MIPWTTTCETVVFCSSSGHCQLDCPYCINFPVLKKKISLNDDDIGFFLEQIQTSAFFIFSGVGDFFAGYARKERFLEKVLTRDVEVVLDINGLLIHEYAELTPELNDKIKIINLTFHYNEIKTKRALHTWLENARTIITRHRGKLILGYIISPESDDWEEGLQILSSEICRPNSIQCWLIPDVHADFSEEQRLRIETMQRQFADSVERIYWEDFGEPFRGIARVSCPAGRNYFRIDNDGKVWGCPHIDSLKDCGNLKQRVFKRHTASFTCSTPSFCDCFDLNLLGRLEFEQPIQRSSPVRLPLI